MKVIKCIRQSYMLRKLNNKRFKETYMEMLEKDYGNNKIDKFTYLNNKKMIFYYTDFKEKLISLYWHLNKGKLR